MAKRGPIVMQRGTAAVEFALVLPLLLTLVLGAIDWGWLFYLQQVVANGAREAARAGSLEGTDAALAVSDAQVACTAYVTNAGLDKTKAACTATADTGCPSNCVSVTLTYPAGSMTGFLTSIMPAST